jgi:hypothetical protein
MLKRRRFLIASSIIWVSPYIEAKVETTFEKKFKEVKNTIEEVQEHMFPEGSKLPSAKQTHVIDFLFDTVAHESYDKDIRAFIIEGAEELMNRNEKSLSAMNDEEKEKALRTYEQTNYGNSWLSRIMTVTMEGLFSAPIYESNKYEIAWKSIDMHGGLPRPIVKYLEH